MTPEQEDELIEKMKIAYWRIEPGETVDARMRRALSIAMPIIRDEALEEALSVAEDEAQRTGEGDGEFYIARKIADRIAALKSKGQKP